MPFEPGERDGKQLDLRGPEVSAQAVRDELERVLKSPAFRASQRHKDFLRYVVEETIEGRGEKLKEYSIGIDVFRRPESFDPRIDNSVRTEASRLRSRLADYYAREGQHDPIRIEFFRGRFAPIFRPNGESETQKTDFDKNGNTNKSETCDPSLASSMTQAPQTPKTPSSAFLTRKAAAIIVAVLLLGGGSLTWLGWRSCQIRQEAPSIVVVPFQNRTDDRADEFFSDGLTDEIIDSLARVPGLRVVARGAAFELKGKTIDPRQIGKEFNVASVLGGSVRRYNNRLRVTAQLDDTANGYNLWSQSYDRDSRDVLAIQREISLSIAEALGLKLMGKNHPLSQPPAVVNPEAYREYLMGRYFWKKLGKNVQTAIDHFNLAIATDPGYAPAYVGLAHCYVVLANSATVAPLEIAPEIKGAAAKALELDSSLGEAHLDLAAVAEYELDWNTAEQEFKRAFALAPQSAYAHHLFGEYLLRTGRPTEALVQSREAAALDPVSPFMAMSVGSALYHNRQFDEAIAAFQGALTLDPGFSIAHGRLGLAYIQKAEFDRALAEFGKRDLPYQPDNVNLAYGYAVSGEKAKARMMLGKLLEKFRREPMRALSVAKVYIGLGDKDKAFEWLRKALGVYDPGLFLKTDPLYDPLRADPRFGELLRRMKLD